MDSENQEVIYYADGEYRIYCDTCDQLCIERFHKKHLESQTHFINIHRRQKLNKKFQIFLYK